MLYGTVSILKIFLRIVSTNLWSLKVAGLVKGYVLILYYVEEWW